MEWHRIAYIVPMVPLRTYSLTYSLTLAISTATAHGPSMWEATTRDWLCTKSMATIRLLPLSHTKTQSPMAASSEETVTGCTIF